MPYHFNLECYNENGYQNIDFTGVAAENGAIVFSAEVGNLWIIAESLSQSVWIITVSVTCHINECNLSLAFPDMQLWFWHQSSTKGLEHRKELVKHLKNIIEIVEGTTKI